MWHTLHIFYASPVGRYRHHHEAYRLTTSSPSWRSTVRCVSSSTLPSSPRLGLFGRVAAAFTHIPVRIHLPCGVNFDFGLLSMTPCTSGWGGSDFDAQLPPREPTELSMDDRERESRGTAWLASKTLKFSLAFVFARAAIFTHYQVQKRGKR